MIDRLQERKYSNIGGIHLIELWQKPNDVPCMSRGVAVQLYPLIVARNND